MIMLTDILLLLAAANSIPAAEEPVDPYEMSDANAGAEPNAGDRLFRAFHGHEGIDRVVAELIALSVADPRISETFKGHDLVRLDRTLGEQFCYLLGGGCTYSGRDMKSAHKDMGLQTTDLTALIENLQRAMDKEQVPFRAQLKLLGKLAPMRRDTVER